MIKSIIYHDLKKSQHTTVCEIELNPKILVPNNSHIKFLDALIKAYAGRSGKGFGVFDSDENSYPMPKLLRNFLEDNDFYSLTESMMKILKKEISQQPLATGGKVFIANYEQDNHHYILIAILTEKTAYLTKDWDMSEEEVLDIENLKFAGRVNLTDWQETENRYVSFLKGQKDSVAGYFKNFLACNDAVMAKIETKQLVNMLKEFAKEQNLESDKKYEFFNNTQDYLRNIIDNNVPFELEVFANHCWPIDPQILKEKLGNPDIGISDGFIPDAGVIRGLSVFKAKTKHWTLAFDTQAIVNGDIITDNGKIIIVNPTDDLLKAFQSWQ